MKKFEIAPVYSPIWKKMYTLIQKFVRAEPWELFENEDVFIVQSPRDNQMYLCCVMGNAGEEYGFNAFRGAQGMRNFKKMVTSVRNSPPNRDLKYELDMLSFSLCPRDYMEKHDLMVTRKLMLSFTGGKWPMIRSYRPNYFPWFMTEPEIEAFCDCLEQTLELYNKGEEAIDEIRNAALGEMVVRSIDSSVWVSRKVHIGYPAKETVPEVHLDDITIQRLLNLPDTGLREEIDLAHFPGAIHDHEPPYYSFLLLGIDEQQFAHQYGLFPPFREYFQASCDKLVESFLSRGSKPCTVVLRNGSPFAEVFETVARQANITFEKSDTLPYISDLLDSMEQEMADGSFPQD